MRLTPEQLAAARAALDAGTWDGQSRDGLLKLLGLPVDPDGPPAAVVLAAAKPGAPAVIRCPWCRCLHRTHATAGQTVESPCGRGSVRLEVAE